MKIYSSYLDIQKFEKDFYSEIRHYRHYNDTDDEKTLVENVIVKINDAHRSIPEFLRSLDDIKDQQIQMCCRSIAIAQMYKAKLNYRSGSPYVETSPYSKDILLLKCQGSTAIVSKYGEIIIDEGEISTHSGMSYSGGFVVVSVSDRKYGFISSSGSVILPCIFDDCDMHIGEYNFLYKGVNFKLCLYGKINSVEKDSLQRIIDGYDETDAIYCVNGESDFFILYQRELLPGDYKYVRTSKDTKAAVLQKIASLLSNVVTSKENLQSVLI